MKRFAAIGDGYSGDYDTLLEAQRVVNKNGNGAVYILASEMDALGLEVERLREEARKDVDEHAH